MKKKLCEMNLILIILNCIIMSRMNVCAQNIDNTQQDVGDPCVFPDKSVGTCTSFADCEYVKKLISERKSSKIVRCKFDGKIPIICCPRKSKKFESALCKEKLPPPNVLTVHIINGKKADFLEFPHQAAIFATNSLGETEFICGGSLIADDIVLTAAHCANKRNLMPSFVKLGRVSLDPKHPDDYGTAQDITIEKMELHPSYGVRSRHHDLALIKLKTPAIIGEGTEVNTICLSTRNDVEDKNFTVTGFGTTESGAMKRSDWLLKAYVQKYKFDECQRMYQIVGMTVIDSQFCALSDQGQDTCQGDSGGPMMYKADDGIPFLFGATSYGAGCGSATFPSIYTRVDQYLDWIEAAMAKLGS